MGLVIGLYRRPVCLNELAAMKQQCADCQGEFSCEANSGLCWCGSFPAIMPLEINQTCRCPACLAKAIAKQIDQSLLEHGCEKMVELARQYQNKSELVELIDYTIENGKMVFSKWYHLKRGTCCGNDCRNCPYDKN